MTDLELLERWRAGDREAGETLLDRHLASLWRFFGNKVGAEGEELIQKTLLGCVEGLPRNRSEASFRTYLFSIARKTLYKHLRERYRDGERFEFEVTSIEDLATSASRRVAREQDNEALHRAMSELPLNQQLLLELHYWEQMDASALAAVFDISPVTARTRLHRARANLSRRLQQS